MPRMWNEQKLAEMRKVGDPVADAVVGGLFESGGIEVVNDLMRKLVTNDGIPSAQLPQSVRDYLESTGQVRPADRDAVAQGEQLFARLGPEMLAVLGFYGLPMDYAAGKGVQVLYRTAYLARRPMRRVLETTQMVVDVLSPGGLSPTGRGVRAAQKVRLMHAAVRHLIRNDPTAPWDNALGMPINQEDLAGTLMTFAYIVLAGLERLGLPVSTAEREAYFQCWMAVGRMMGVREDLVPANVAEGRELAWQIFNTQGESTPQGKELAKDLIGGYQRLLPGFLGGMPASMMHFFLEQESLTGRDIAAMLDVPPPNWTLSVTRLAVSLDDFLSKHGIDNPLSSSVAGFIGRELIKGFLSAERMPGRATFSIPVDLHEQWSTIVQTV
jgi:hypothetical protein